MICSFLPFLAPAVTLTHTIFVFFCHVYPPRRLASFTGLSSSFFSAGLDFQLLSQARMPLPSGFCHLSKSRCHFHSPSHPLAGRLLIRPTPLHPLLLACISYRAELCLRRCVIPILRSQNRFFLRFGTSRKHLFFFFFFPTKTSLPFTLLHFPLTSPVLPGTDPPPTPYSPFAFIKPRHREVQKIHFRRQQL